MASTARRRYGSVALLMAAILLACIIITPFTPVTERGGGRVGPAP